MAVVRLPYLKLVRNPYGRVFAYYSRGGARFPLPPPPQRDGDLPDEAFLTAYRQRHAAFQAAEAAAAERATALVPGSFAALLATYRASPEWSQLKPSTRADYEKAMAPIEDRLGPQLVARFERKHVRMLRDLYARKPKLAKNGQPELDRAGQPVLILTPRRANKVVTVLSILLSYAVDPLGWRPDNPALRAKKLRTEGGYRAWSEAEVAQLLAHAPDLRTAVLLALGTGQRSGDLVRMTWRDYDGTAIAAVPEKTRTTSGITLWVPCHPDVAAELDRAKSARPSTPFPAATILVRPDGQPWDVLQFQTAMSKAIRAAGLRGVVLHGLRATSATWLAEAGCTDSELQAIFGWTSTRMAAHYRRGADRKLQASAAIEKLAGRRRLGVPDPS